NKIEDDGKTSLVTFKCDQDAIRKSLAQIIIVDELPFKFVEGKGFQQRMLVACRRFKIPSRWTISIDCLQFYLGLGFHLKCLFTISRDCLQI
ncbi:hypothetical protein Tsubulata_005132, partial [Turnera subulata]